MPEARRPGRPRSPEVQSAILAATRALLVEGGYAAVSMDRVAARAGVGIQTVYRRWSSKAPMVVEAVLEALDRGFVVDIPATEHVFVDLAAWMRDVAAFLADPDVAPLVMSLAAAAAESPDSVRDLYNQLSATYLDGVLHRLRLGVEAQQVRDDANLTSVASAVIGLNIFSAVSRLAAGGDMSGLEDGLIDALANGLRPR